MVGRIQQRRGLLRAIAFWLSYIVLLASLRSEHNPQRRPTGGHITTLPPLQPDIIVAPGAAQPPALPDSFMSSSHRFNIHYTTFGSDAPPAEDANHNAVPDYIEQIAAAFDESYRVEIEQLHYREPPSFQNGTMPYHIYVLNLGNTSGLTITELKDSSAAEEKNVSSHILFENDFVGPDFHVQGDEAIRTTAAHEFFHAIQLGYVFRKSDSFFYELTAVWMADRVFDEIDKHFYYLDYFFAAPEIPLTGVSFTIPNVFKHIYGSCIFAFYLAENFGIDAIRWIWEQMPEQSALLAVDQLCRKQGSRLEAELVKFATWNFFTGCRAQPGYSYSESSLLPEIRTEMDTLIQYYHQQEGTGYFLTAAYFIFQPMADGEFRVVLTTEHKSHWRLGVAVYDALRLETFIAAPDEEVHLKDITTEQKIVIIPCNVDYTHNPTLIYFKEQPESYTFYLQRETRLQPDLARPFQIEKIYPNPFSIGVTFWIKKLDSAPLSIQIFNINGEQVACLAEELTMTDLTQIHWRPSMQASRLAAGIYLCRCSSREYSETIKLILYR